MSADARAEAQRLIDWLRTAAEVLESAARYGVPIPGSVSVSGYEHEHGGLSFHADLPMLEAWTEYVREETPMVYRYHYKGQDWTRVTVHIDGLDVVFHAVHTPRKAHR